MGMEEKEHKKIEWNNNVVKKNKIIKWKTIGKQIK